MPPVIAPPKGDGWPSTDRKRISPKMHLPLTKSQATNFNDGSHSLFPHGGPGLDICHPPQHHCQIPGKAAECCPEPWLCINGLCTDPNDPRVCGETMCDPSANECLDKGYKKGICCPKGESVCGKVCCRNEDGMLVQNYCADARRQICCPEGQVAQADGSCGPPLCGGVACDGAFNECRAGVCCAHGKQCGATGCCQGTDNKGRERICWNHDTSTCGVKLGNGATVGLGGA
ncbi:hypothetical protein MMC21_007253 [Puttea exsequens]|nr:hypothetical protein [Puttea exsequens]